ncbi:MAG: sensor histidine kinase [Bacillota bacterium]|nr:sensor histidine kinase [Bacillota bacterium]MDI3299540.1 sensor histidine kinase [Bacillota bacterium]
MLRWIRSIHERVSMLWKVMIANGVIIVIGAVGGVSLTLWGFRSGTVLQAMLPFVVLGLAATLAVNFLLVELAFRPIYQLRDVMEAVEHGQLEARAPEIRDDPDVRRVAETLNAMLDRLQQQRRMAASQILAALEGERKRIARELHDETSQALATLLLHLDLTARSLPRCSDEQGQSQVQQAQKRLQESRQLVETTLDEVRKLTVELRPTVLDDLGLVPALRWYVHTKLDPAGVEAKLDVTGFEHRLPDELETVIFRVVQEAITNVLLHARAQRVSVELHEEPDLLYVRVQDDGRGFSPEQLIGQPERSIGLAGMRERAALVGGRLEIRSRPGQGTTVELTIPRKEGAVRDEAHSRVAG